MSDSQELEPTGQDSTGQDPTGEVAQSSPDSPLARLAAQYGVAAAYQNWADERVQVADETVVQVLGLLGVDASGDAEVERALAAAEVAPWRRLVDPTVVVRQGAPASLGVRAPAGVRPVVRVVLEDGSVAPAPEAGEPEEERDVDGTRRVLTPHRLADLPLGWHRVEVTAGEETGSGVLVVAPPRVELPASLERAWGWMTQLYSVRSSGDWGLGDYADLAELVRWSGGLGAGVLLVNPLHAPAPLVPVEPSPYSPSSRRFRSPVYLRVTATPEYTAADAGLRARVDALRPDTPADRIDRDVVWAAVAQALELLYPGSRAPERERALAAYQQEQGPGLTDFATWCALAERHGVPWHDWPEQLRNPQSEAVAEARAELSDRVRFYCWLQLLCDEQLAAAAAAARETGMPVGVVHDLAVGVDAGGADAWALQADLALGVTVGAPPDSFNQKGQDWGLPPWRPDRLPETGYAPFRDMVRSVLRHAGGIRVDHVMGLSRLWWVPPGCSAAEGTYVSYDLDAMLGVIALEATRAGAVVVGEDLGTVEPAVTEGLADNGVLGSAVLWFEREADGTTPLPPGQWRELAMASVTTHDLPTAAGFLTSEHVRVRSELGQLGRPVEEEQASADRERAALLALARSEGVLGDDTGDAEADLEAQVLALHALLVRSPSRLVLAALGDALRDRRQPNLPGTTDEYPNWRLPVARPPRVQDGEPEPVSFEELRVDPAVTRLAKLLTDGVSTPAGAGGSRAGSAAPPAATDTVSRPDPDARTP